MTPGSARPAAGPTAGSLRRALMPRVSKGTDYLTHLRQNEETPVVPAYRDVRQQDKDDHQDDHQLEDAVE